MIITKKDHLKWKDGRRFARRVHVHSLSQMGTLYHTHADEAMLLCKQGSAVPIDAVKGEKQIAGIILVRTPDNHHRRKGIPKFTTNNYVGQQYIVEERLGPEDSFAGLTCYQFDMSKV